MKEKHRSDFSNYCKTPNSRNEIYFCGVFIIAEVLFSFLRQEEQALLFLNSGTEHVGVTLGRSPWTPLCALPAHLRRNFPGNGCSPTCSRHIIAQVTVAFLKTGENMTYVTCIL